MNWNKLMMILIVAPLLTLLLGCGSGDNTNSPTADISSGTGTLSVGMTDASTDQYQAVYVTIKEVQAHMSVDSESSWNTVGSPNKTYNLLELVNNTRESLGIALLNSGHYSQMRLILGATPDNSINILSKAHPFANYVIDLAGVEHELKVPSGMQSGIKIAHEFDINVNSTTEIILDFDASASVVVAGKSGKYILKPTIKVLTISESSIINGVVRRSSNDSDLANAMVLAQIFDESELDAKNRITVQASTITDDTGHFSLFLSPGTYNLVFYKHDFLPVVTRITVASAETATANASLNVASTGTIFGTVDINGSDSESYVTLSFRQTIMIDGINEEIELFSLNIADGGSYSATVPSGNLTVVSSSSGKTTQVDDVIINAGLNTSLNISI